MDQAKRRSAAEGIGLASVTATPPPAPAVRPTLPVAPAALRVGSALISVVISIALLGAVVLGLTSQTNRSDVDVATPHRLGSKVLADAAEAAPDGGGLSGATASLEPRSRKPQP